MSTLLAGVGMTMLLFGLGLLGGVCLALVVLGISALGDMIDRWVKRVLQ